MEMVDEGQSQVQFSPELMNLQEIVVTEQADRIGSLPDNVLVEILSRLPSTEEAIRTGTLSKRWEHLWTLIPVLRFRQIRDNQPLSEFVSLVDKTLTKCRQLKLKSFVLISEYDAQFESQFNNWIRYAISCNVELLGISIRNCRAQLFDQDFFTTSCFSDLRFLGCQLNPIGAISWKNLRFLRVSYVNVEEHLIENILSGSPQLETLVFDSCYGFSLLNITSKSLKNLVLAGYRNSKLYDEVGDVIEINAPNILSLTIVEVLQMRTLLLLNVSSLVEANLDYDLLNCFKRIPKEVKEETLKGLILNLHHVKELKTGSCCSKVLSRLEAKGFTLPSNMKSLDSCFHWSDRFG